MYSAQVRIGNPMAGLQGSTRTRWDFAMIDNPCSFKSMKPTAGNRRRQPHRISITPPGVPSSLEVKARSAFIRRSSATIRPMGRRKIWPALATTRVFVVMVSLHQIPKHAAAASKAAWIALDPDRDFTTRVRSWHGRGAVNQDAQVKPGMIHHRQQTCRVATPVVKNFFPVAQRKIQHRSTDRRLKQARTNRTGKQNHAADSCRQRRSEIRWPYLKIKI